jgi:hypothetical protein
MARPPAQIFRAEGECIRAMFVPAIRLVDEFVTGQLGIYPMALGGFLVWRVGHGGSGLGRPKAQICAPS